MRALVLPKFKRALARHADLLAEKKIENEQEERDRHKADEGLGEDVRLRPIAIGMLAAASFSCRSVVKFRKIVVRNGTCCAGALPTPGRV